MQIAALRPAIVAKLSSNSSTNEEYWLTSTSAGIPSGYCCSQKRFTIFPLQKTYFSVSFDLLPWPTTSECSLDGRTSWGAAQPRARRLGAPHLLTKHQP